jgi:acyl carrier protein
VTGGNAQVEVDVAAGVKEALRAHLSESLRVRLDEDPDDRDLLGEGLIDSMAVMELVAFIEENFEVFVADEEIIADNFRSLESMVQYVVYKRTGLKFVSQYVLGVRDFVTQATPPNAFVLLLNSGDDQLLDVADRVVWPFPCDEHGVEGSTGHPADGRQAIAMLERLYQRGATHVVFLEPELWWLDHYQGLGPYLERHGGPVAQSALGVAYALSPSASA